MGEAEGCGIVGVLSFHSLEVGPTAVHMRRRAVDRTKRRQKVSCWGSVFVHYTHTHTHTQTLCSLPRVRSCIKANKWHAVSLPPFLFIIQYSLKWHSISQPTDIINLQYAQIFRPNLQFPEEIQQSFVCEEIPQESALTFSLREESCHAGGLARRMLLGTVSPLRLAPLSGAVRRRRPWHFHSQCWICFQYKIHQSSVSLRRCQRDIWIWFVGPQGEHLLLACTYR